MFLAKAPPPQPNPLLHFLLILSGTHHVTPTFPAPPLPPLPFPPLPSPPLPPIQFTTPSSHLTSPGTSPDGAKERWKEGGGGRKKEGEADSERKKKKGRRIWLICHHSSISGIPIPIPFPQGPPSAISIPNIPIPPKTWLFLRFPFTQNKGPFELREREGRREKTALSENP